MFDRGLNGNWRVVYRKPDGTLCHSVLMKKWYAKDMAAMLGGLYIEKVKGLRKRKIINKDNPNNAVPEKQKDNEVNL